MILRVELAALSKEATRWPLARVWSTTWSPGCRTACRRRARTCSGRWCRSLRDLLTTVPKSSQRWVATMVRTVFDQPDAAEVAAQFDPVVAALAAKLPRAA